MRCRCFYAVFALYLHCMGLYCSVGVGSGVHSTHIQEQKKDKDLAYIRHQQASLDHIVSLETTVEEKLHTHVNTLSRSLAAFVTAQSQCIACLSRRVKLSLTKLSHLKSELAAYQKLSLPHMVVETESRSVERC